jgi:hypothetical protein
MQFLIKIGILEQKYVLKMYAFKIVQPLVIADFVHVSE